MQKISDTFCPAKWDELQINLESNFVYACCKATPVKITENFENVLEQQKYNLLNNIQDPSCNYCWEVEKNNLTSLRHNKLKNYTRDYKEYIDNCSPTNVEINLGNECNFQCVYCNPKFSSRWQSDVTKKPYKLYSDKFFYAIPINHSRKKEQITKLFNHYSKRSQTIGIIGGEPFYNKSFFQIIKNLQSPNLVLTTNLSAHQDDIQKFFELTRNFESVILQISIDSTGDVAEFTRFGINFLKFKDNLKFVLENAPKNYTIELSSVFTSTTILDLHNTINFIIPLLSEDRIRWNLYPCINPRFHSFATLKDTYKSELLILLEQLKSHSNIRFVDSVKSAILSNKFNNTMYNQLKHFYNEFAARKKVKIPFNL